MKLPSLCLCLLLPLMACKSADPHYYNLSAQPGTPQPGKKLVIKVQRPGIDSTLDRPQMVRQGKNMRIEYDNMALWSAPLDKMIESVVAEDLEKRLPGSSVITESGGIVTQPDYMIDLEIRQFGINSKDQAAIKAVLLINTPSSSGKPQSIELSQVTSDPGSSEPKSLSSVLANLSDKIAQELRNKNHPSKAQVTDM